MFDLNTMKLQSLDFYFPEFANRIIDTCLLDGMKCKKCDISSYLYSLKELVRSSNQILAKVFKKKSDRSQAALKMFHNVQLICTCIALAEGQETVEGKKEEQVG